MIKAVKTTNIKAPVEKVFDYLSEPTNLPEIWPSLVEINDVQRLPSGGAQWWYQKPVGVQDGRYTLERHQRKRRC